MKHIKKLSNYLSAGYMLTDIKCHFIIMSQQCHFQTSVCYMHYIKRDIFVFKVNLQGFKKEKSKKCKNDQQHG